MTNCPQCGKPSETLADGVCPKCQTGFAPTLEPSNTADLIQGTSQPVRNSSLQSGSGQFGEYELLEEIARGGMGVVFKARHQKLNRITALKMVLGGRFSSEEEIQRFHIEAESAARLDHPGIVPVYEIGEEEGQPFFAMKYISGGSLADHMARLCDEPKEAMKLLAKVARAVHHAHQRGVLHRDLKPGNILLDEDGEPLITDLGLAKSTSGDSNLTNTGAVMGTPSYMPPEQASGGIVTTAADIYSLGAIMYQLLVGEPPHQGSTAMETVMKVVSEPPAPPSDVKKDVDRALEAISMKCLEFAPEQRYSSALQMAMDLEAWSEGKPISVKATSLRERTKRWFRENSRFVYTAFIVLTGFLLNLPFALGFFLSPDVWENVYSRFPAEDRPWLYSFHVRIPGWLFGLTMSSLVLLFYPSIGLLNAVFSRTKTLIHAVLTGVLTSFILAVIITLLIGWIPVVGQSSEQSSDVIEALGNVAWQPDGMTEEEARTDALDLFDGLEDIPPEERAYLIASRVSADQFARALNTMFAVLLAIGFFSVPVVMGTTIGHLLLQRGNAFWLCLIRYFIAWWCLLICGMLLLSFVVPGGPRINGRPAEDMPGTLWTVIAISGMLAFLVLRRWKRKRPSTPSSMSSMDDPTTPMLPS